MIVATVRERSPAHVYVRLSVGPDIDHLAVAGTLVFRVEEWDHQVLPAWRPSTVIRDEPRERDDAMVRGFGS